METKNITITDKGIKKHPRGGYGQYLAFGCVNGVEVSAHTTDSETYDWWNDDSDEEKHEEALETLDSLLLSAFENLLHDDSWLASFMKRGKFHVQEVVGQIAQVPAFSGTFEECQAFFNARLKRSSGLWYIVADKDLIIDYL